MALHVFVIRETELEDPQDLRAESGKCPNSTNERKNMSTKTLRKRIALVAVAALGAGVLSVAPANAANNNAVGGENVAPATDVLNVAVASSITGAAIVSSTPEDGATEANFSLGLLAVSSTLTTSSLTSTATMRADGEIVFYTKTANNVAATFEVSGGTIGSVDAQGTPFNNINASKTSYVTGAATASTQIAFSVVPNAGATSVIVSMYKSASLATIDATKVAAVQAGTTSKGSLVQRYVVTVATTSASGVYSSAESYVQAQEPTASALAAPTTNVDEAIASATATYPTANPLTIGNSASSVGFVSFDLRDAYGVSLSGTGALVVSATNGAGVALYDTVGGYGAATSVTLLTTVSNYASGTITVARPTAMANKGFSTTVTISWNGVVVGTKSFTFLGEVASMVVTPRRIANLNTSNTDAFRVTYADSAGNALITLGTSATSVVSTTTTSAVTNAAIGTQGTATDAAKGTITCAAGASAYLGGGTAKLQLQHVNSVSGTTVKSNVFDATCQGNAYSYVAGFDKTTYTPGSIATLTITFKDRDGDLANGYDTWAASNVVTITGGPSATAVAIPVVGDKADSGSGLAGIKTYQFVVGSTEGDFQAVVSVPDVNSRNSSQTNQTVAYTVKASSSAVSNADVLKAIVSLIASINKQIAALQKALLKK